MNKLTVQDIVDFFHEKLSFEKSNSIQHGWSPTRGGLYSITDIYKYFEEKGFDKKEVDDIKWKHFQLTDRDIKLEKGKTHLLFKLNVKNFNPEYKREPYFCYYYYGITKEEAVELKNSYEEYSRITMAEHSEKKISANNISISRANRKIKESKPRTKKPVTTI